jgi:hypothetical protein
MGVEFVQMQDKIVWPILIQTWNMKDEARDILN